ncbi:MAG TPA: DUF3224 domain-containing protein [Myxococcales bacterium]|jgi:hypothetical protein|nr:DUF3224 domain-containing protein [Myxococcales bacterium]
MTTQRAKGPFAVKLAPLAMEPGAVTGRMSIDKTFEGDLTGTSVGQMLAFQTADKTSGGYVAIEQVTGTLHGRRGAFFLQHFATMDRGAPSMNIIVVPGSGTGELEGLKGKLTIEIAAGGAHSYVLDYELP